MPAHSQGHKKFLAGREARTLLIVWWFVCGIVLFHGLLFAMNGAPFALASVFLWILISKMWEEFVTHLRSPNDSRPVWNSAMGVILTAFTMGVFFAFLTLGHVLFNESCWLCRHWLSPSFCHCNSGGIMCRSF